MKKITRRCRFEIPVLDENNIRYKFGHEKTSPLAEQLTQQGFKEMPSANEAESIYIKTLHPRVGKAISLVVIVKDNLIQEILKRDELPFAGEISKIVEKDAGLEVSLKNSDLEYTQFIEMVQGQGFASRKVTRAEYQGKTFPASSTLFYTLSSVFIT